MFLGRTGAVWGTCVLLAVCTVSCGPSPAEFERRDSTGVVVGKAFGTQDQWARVHELVQRGISVKGAEQGMPLEEYVTRCVECEAAPNSGVAAYEALAIACRSMAVYWTVHNWEYNHRFPLDDSEATQRFACSKIDNGIDPVVAQAVANTQGQFLAYNGVPIAGFHVTGDPAVAAEGHSGASCRGSTNNPGAETEWRVTYNEGQVGPNKCLDPGQMVDGQSCIHPAVKPHGDPASPHNRGALSQNGLKCLGRRNYNSHCMLGYYFGADIDLHHLSNPSAAARPQIAMACANGGRQVPITSVTPGVTQPASSGHPLTQQPLQATPGQLTNAYSQVSASQLGLQPASSMLFAQAPADLAAVLNQPCNVSEQCGGGVAFCAQHTSEALSYAQASAFYQLGEFASYSGFCTARCDQPLQLEMTGGQVNVLPCITHAGDEPIVNEYGIPVVNRGQGYVTSPAGVTCYAGTGPCAEHIISDNYCTNPTFDAWFIEVYHGGVPGSAGSYGPACVPWTRQPAVFVGAVAMAPSEAPGVREIATRPLDPGDVLPPPPGGENQGSAGCALAASPSAATAQPLLWLAVALLVVRRRRACRRPQSE